MSSHFEHQPSGPSDRSTTSSEMSAGDSPAQQLRRSVGQPSATRPSGGLIRLLVIAITVSLVALPAIFSEAPNEAARWHAASAAIEREQGNSERALELLEKAISLDPDSDDLYRVRGNWLVDDEEYEAALEQFDKAVQLRPDNPLNYVDRSVALQHVGRHADAVRDWDKIIELNQGQDLLACSRFLSGNRFQVRVYNARAYARSLAGIELNEGLEDVERAMKSMGSLGQNAAFLDTRGYLELNLGELDSAIRDLNLAVRLIEQQLSDWPKQRDILRHQELDQRGLEEVADELRKSVAVIRYHRGLAHKTLGDDDAAEVDFERVRTLGFEPNEQLF